MLEEEEQWLQLLSWTARGQRSWRPLRKNCSKTPWTKNRKKFLIYIFKKYRSAAHKSKITSSGQTAMHVAVSEGTVKAVKELLEHIKRKFWKLKKGIYPSAGSADDVKGYVKCERCGRGLATGSCSWQFWRNYYLQGGSDYSLSFTCNSIWRFNGGDLSFCFRLVGQSIIHCAINREYFAEWF